jgi:hypothetical protein
MGAARISLSVSACVLSVLLVACTSTKFSGLWRDETYQERPGKILVVSQFPNPATRRLFEGALVETVQKRGVEAVASYTIMPDTPVIGKEALAAQAATVGADMLLVNSPLSARTEVLASPSTPYTFEEVYIGTRTEVYETKSSRLVFHVSAETWVRQDVPTARSIRSYVNVLANELSRSGLFQGKSGEEPIK